MTYQPIANAGDVVGLGTSWLLYTRFRSAHDISEFTWTGAATLSQPGRVTVPANRYARNSTTPVSRLYIEPAIFMVPVDSRSRSTGLFSRMLAIVSNTFFRATA